MKTRESPTNQMVQKVIASPLKAEPKGESALKIKLPHDCSIRGALIDRTEGREMFISNFQVNPKLQQHGIGPRLLKSLIAVAKLYDVKYLTGHVTSEAALKTRARLVGEDNVEFYEPKPGGGGQRLQLTYQEALDRMGATGQTYEVKSDITSIDTRDWELPDDLPKLM